MVDLWYQTKKFLRLKPETPVLMRDLWAVIKELTVNVNSSSSSSYPVSGQAIVNFGAITQEDSIAYVTIFNSSVKTNSNITITPSGISTADHDPDDYQWDNISGYPTNIVNGTSFDITGVAPNGSWGQYIFNYLIN